MSFQRKSHPGFSGATMIGVPGLNRLPGFRPALMDEEPGEGAPAESSGDTATQDPPAGGQQSNNQPGGGSNPPSGQQNNAPPRGMTQTELQAIAGIVSNNLTQSVNTRFDAIEQRQNQLTQTIEELRKPQENGFQGFFVRDGEDPLTSRGFQFHRIMGLLINQLPKEECKVELEVHEQLHKAYVENGKFEKEDPGSILIPLGAQMLGNALPRDFKIELQQRMRLGVDGFDPGHAEWMMKQSMERRGYGRQALSSVDDTAMGIFLGETQVAGEMIQLLRNKEVFSRAGATNLTLPPNGRLKFHRQTGAVTAYWVGETPGGQTSPTITASEPTTGSLNMQAKKLACLAKLPNELIRFGDASVEAFLRQDMAIESALQLDLTSLEGTNTGDAPTGIINYAGILTRAGGTLDTDGDTLEPEDLQLIISDLEQANHDPEASGLTWVMRPELSSQILNRRSSVYDGSTTSELGPFMFTVNREDISRGMPMMLQGHPMLKSNQVSNTRTKGSGTDLTYLLAGIFRHWIIARSGVAEFATTDKGDTTFTTDQTWLRMIQHIDVGPRYENAFLLVDDLLREL